MPLHGDVVETDIVTGRRTRLAEDAASALRVLVASGAPFAVIGATALAARGLPRMTADLDIVVMVEDAFAAIDALLAAGFRSLTPIARDVDPEPMYVLVHATGSTEVDVLVALSEPESTIVAEATTTILFDVPCPVATLEHLLLLYLYSNQPRHLGDFARIVTDTTVDLVWVERYLAEVHPEMLPVLCERVEASRHPAPSPKRPPRRRRP